MNSIRSAMKKYKEATSLSDDVKKEMWQKTVLKMEPSTAKKTRWFPWVSANFLPIAATIIVATGFYLANTNSNGFLAEKKYYMPITSPSVTSQAQNNGTLEYETNDSAPKPVQYSVGKSNNTTIRPTSTVYPTIPPDNNTSEKDRIKQVNSELRYNVELVAKAVTDLYNLIVNYKGYVIQSNVGLEAASFVFKVPLDKFQEFKSQLDKIGTKLTYEQTYTVDRQPELTNLETGKTTMEQEIKKIQDRLSKAQSQQEKNTIQKELDEANAKLTAQNKAIENIKEDTKMATVSVSFAVDTESFAANLKRTTMKTLGKIGEGAVVAINWLIYVAAIAIPVGLLTFIFRAIKRKFASPKK